VRASGCRRPSIDSGMRLAYNGQESGEQA